MFEAFSFCFVLLCWLYLLNKFLHLLELMSNNLKHIWIVDDSEMDLLVTSRILRLSGFTGKITTYSSATKALDFLNQNKNEAESLPELIFLDRSMPLINGNEFVNKYELLVDQLARKAKIVMLSAGTSNEDKKMVSSNSVMLKVIQKPLTLDSVKSILEAENETFV